MIPLISFEKALAKVMQCLSFVELGPFEDIEIVWEKLLSLAREKDEGLFEIIERVIGDTKEIAAVAFAENNVHPYAPLGDESFLPTIERWVNKKEYYEVLKIAASSVYAPEWLRERAYQELHLHPGFIYFLSCEEGYTKIGRSKEPQTRIAGFFNTLPPFEFTIEHIFPASDDRQAEKELHERFADKRKNGEWFLLTQEDLQWAKQIKEYTVRGFDFESQS